MATAPVILNKILGLNRTQDPKQFPAPSVITGKNFLVDAQGPISAFGTELVSEEVLANPENCQTFRVDEGIFIASTGVILAYNEDSQVYYPKFQFTDADELYPWTCTLCGVDYFFAKKGVTGLIVYNSVTGQWSQVTSLTGISGAVYGVCSSGGRLIILSEGLISWSAIDSGTDLTASSATGAGFQSLAIIGKGLPLGVFETDPGFMVMTRTGLLAFDLVTSYPVFRFRRIRTTEVPINPYAITNIAQGTIIYVAKAGFRITNGNPPQPWEALQSEYLTQKVFPSIDLSVNPIVKLTYNADRNWFIVSISSIAQPQLYLEALVLYIPTEQWGTFNVEHYGFGEVNLTAGPFEGFNFGFFCSNGRAHKFVNLYHRETTRRNAGFDNWFYHRPSYEIPVQNTAARLIFSSVIHLHDVYTGISSSVAGIYGLSELVSGSNISAVMVPSEDADDSDYVIGADWNALSDEEDWNVDSGEEDWNLGGTITFPSGVWLGDGYLVNSWAIIGPQFASIDSWVRIGLIRILDGEHVDRLTQLNNLIIGSDPTAIFVYEDYADFPDTVQEDWNSLNGDEDWGNDVPTSSDYDVTIFGSIDGISVFEANETIPNLTYEALNARHYSFTSSGIWHFIDVKAERVDTSFHLKTLETSGILAGRLF